MTKSDQQEAISDTMHDLAGPDEERRSQISRINLVSAGRNSPCNWAVKVFALRNLEPAPAYV